MYKLTITFKTNQPDNFAKIKNFLFFIKKNYSIQQSSIIKNIALKKKTKKFTVLKSPHVHKQSREHFQYKVNQKLYCFVSTNLLPLLYLNYLLSTQTQISCTTHSNLSMTKKCL